MSTTKETQTYNSILESRNEIIQLMSGLRPIGPVKNDYLLVDFPDFSFKKVKLSKYEKSCFNNSLNYLVYPYSKLSILELCRMKLYYKGLELFLPIEDITRAVKIWISWARYIPMSAAISLLNMEVPAIFSSVLN